MVKKCLKNTDERFHLKENCFQQISQYPFIEMYILISNIECPLSFVG